MGRILFVTGTDTGVGKTVVSAWLASVTPDDWQVALVKPAQTGGDPLVDGDEAYYRAALSGPRFSFSTLASLPEPLAPSIAARRAGTELSFDALVGHCRQIAAEHDLAIIEGSGGMLVTIDDRHDFADMAAALEAPLVIALRPGLGTLNHTLLTVEAARRRGLEVALLVASGVAATPPVVQAENLAFLREKLPAIPLVALRRLPRGRLTDLTGLRPRWVGGEPTPALEGLDLGAGRGR